MALSIYARVVAVKGRQMKTIAAALLFVVFLGTLSSQAQDETWETISIPGICTFQIPPTVEIQKGNYKQLSDQIEKTFIEITTSPERVIAQPKGINDFDPAALNRYCRIIVETDRGAKGDFLKLNEPVAASEAGLRKLDEIRKAHFQQEAARSTSKGMKMTILSWQPVKIVRVNGVNAILTTYTRSMNDAPPALVKIYEIQNNDVLHRITISYRESEKALWADDLDKVVDTFKFKKR